MRISNSAPVRRSSVRPKEEGEERNRGKGERERGGGVDKISLPARNDNEDELDVLKGRYIFSFTQCETVALLSSFKLSFPNLIMIVREHPAGMQPSFFYAIRCSAHAVCMNAT